MKLDNKTLRNIFFGVAGCILLYWLLHETENVHRIFSYVGGLLAPFVVGAAIAFIFNVPMRFIEKYLDIERPGLRRSVAMLLTLIMIFLVLLIVFHLLIPQIQKTVQTLISRLPAFFDRVQDDAIAFIYNNPSLVKLINQLDQNTTIDFSKLLEVDWSSLIQKALSVAGSSVSTIFQGAVSAIGSISTFVVNLVISIVFALYCLGSKEKLATQCRKLLYSLLPERFADETVRVMRLTNSTFANFISGQCLEAVILGCMFAVTMFVLKMPYIPLVSVIIAVTALVPLVGAFVGCCLGAFFIMVDSPMQAVWFVVMFLVLQQIEGNIIYPKVVGNSIGLPGMWVLFAVAIGGGTMGVGGMFLMIPVASVLYTLLSEFAQKRLHRRGIAPEKVTAQPPDIKPRRKRKKKVLPDVQQDAAAQQPEQNNP